MTLFGDGLVTGCDFASICFLNDVTGVTGVTAFPLYALYIKNNFYIYLL